MWIVINNSGIVLLSISTPPQRCFLCSCLSILTLFLSLFLSLSLSLSLSIRYLSHTHALLLYLSHSSSDSSHSLVLSCRLPIRNRARDARDQVMQIDNRRAQQRGPADEGVYSWVIRGLANVHWRVIKKRTNARARHKMFCLPLISSLLSSKMLV